MEGTRPLLVEVQALVTPSELVPPRRVSNGLDRNRLALVLAVLTRHGNVPLGGADVFVNVVGGVRIEEPGADLAVALAVASAARNVPLGPADAATPLAAFGELGLTGELRWVGHPERRIAEARKFGLDPVLGPAGAGARRRRDGAPGAGGGDAHGRAPARRRVGRAGAPSRREARYAAGEDGGRPRGGRAGGAAAVTGAVRRLGPGRGPGRSSRARRSRRRRS